MKDISKTFAVERSQAFSKIAGALNTAIGRLPVTDEAKETIILLFVSLMGEAEHNAFLQGVATGRRYAEIFQGGDTDG